MKKNNNSKFWTFIRQFMFDTIAAMIIWPLMNMFFRVVIDKKEFVYSINDHIFGPIMFGFFFALFTMILDKISPKKNKS